MITKVFLFFRGPNTSFQAYVSPSRRDEIQQTYLIVVFTLTTEIGALIGGIILFTLSQQLFYYVLIMIAFYCIIFTIFLPPLKKNRKKFYSHYSESIAALNQTVRGNSTILMQKSIFWFLDKIINKVRKTNSKQI